MHLIIKRKIQFILLFSSLSIFANPLFIERISSTERIDLHQIIKGDGLILFFKPNCSACKIQITKLECLEKKYKVIALGFGASKKEIHKEAKKLKMKKLFNKNIFFVEEDTLSTFKITRGLSPQLFLYKEGNIIKHFLGLTECRELRSHL